MLTFGLVAELDLVAGREGSALDVVRRMIDLWHAQKVANANAADRRFESRTDDYLDDTQRVWEFELRQDADPGGRWSTEVRALVADAEPRRATVTIAMRLEVDDASLAPVRYYVEPPGFLRALKRDFVLRVGTSTAIAGIKRLDEAASVQAFVAELENLDRSLPIVLVSECGDGSMVIPTLPERLADGLFGLATVVRATREATFALSKEVGRSMSCFDGAVRIYWPRWSPDDPVGRHPLFLRYRVEASAAHDERRPETLIRTSVLSQLVRAATARFGYPQAMRRVIDAHRRARIEADLAHRPQPEVIEQLARLTRDAAEQRELSEMAIAENAELRIETSRLQVEVEQLRGLADALKMQLASLRPAAGQADDQPEAVPDPLVDAEAALRRAREEFADTLMVPASIHIDTRMDGRFWYDVLRALSCLCALERKGEATHKRNQLRQLLVEHVGLSKDTYKAADTGVYVDDPETGRRVQMRERVHLKEGRPAETESVYWLTVGPTRAQYRYLIGRIGRHA